ncbi:protein kinase [Streptomyces sp. NPDC047108]|uniref:serine/threonine-protein kinase n=1 Tax=Streptomyces sp. NPDC047108 TaxID=3155025 RepID=UPI0034080D59
MSAGEHGQGNGQDSGAKRLLAGRYRVVRQLGRGGMGVVCHAVDEALGREVAVKELRTYHDASGPELADLRLRMQREARAAARVRHPGVIAIHDIAEDEGRPLIVMELIDGPSLDDILQEQGVLDPRRAASIGAKVMDALDAAHRAGVLHRDVKPGNVLLGGEGRVVLTDFGIATMEDPGDGASTRLTQSGDIVGSLDYLAPERAQGQLPGPASDVWSLGATLYAAVEGSSPFRRTSTWSTLTAIVAEPLPEPRRAGPLAPVLRELMHKDPQSRPDAQRARELLQAVAEGRPYEGWAGDSATTHLGGPVPGAAGGGVAGAGAGVGAESSGSAASQATGAGELSEPGAQSASAGPSQGFGPAPEFVGPSEEPEPSVPPAAVHPGGYAVNAGDDGSLVTGQRPEAGAGRRRRAVLAAVAALVVLTGAGVTAAVMMNDSGTPETVATDAAASSAREPGERAGDDGRSVGEKAERSDSADGSDRASASPDTQPAGGGEDGKSGDDPASDDGGGSDADGGATGGGSGDGGSAGGDSEGSTAGAGGGGGEPSPAPVCHGIGGGKYNCQVWRTATSYDAAGRERGVLQKGTNYFYCQQQGRRETYDRWTNVWWARTDDDSGNAGVYVSDVYIKGGDNDAPVPGLPVC